MAVPSGYTELAKVGLLDRGTYSASATYNLLDFVYHNGSSWLALKNGLKGVTPVDGANWRYLARGFVEAEASAINITDTSNLTGAGSGKETTLQTWGDKVADWLNSKMTLNGKTVVLLGDSNAERFRDSHALLDMFPTCNFIPLVQSGNSFINTLLSQPSIYAQIDQITETPDVIIIMGGNNSMGNFLGTPANSETYMGAIDGDGLVFDVNTEFGAMNATLSKLCEKYPNALIIGNIRPYYSESYRNINIQRAWFDMLAYVYQRWGIPYIDMTQQARANTNVKALRDRWFTDENGMHMSDEFWKKIYMPILWHGINNAFFGFPRRNLNGVVLPSRIDSAQAVQTGFNKLFGNAYVNYSGATASFFAIGGSRTFTGTKLGNAVGVRRTAANGDESVFGYALKDNGDVERNYRWHKYTWPLENQDIAKLPQGEYFIRTSTFASNSNMPPFSPAGVFIKVVEPLQENLNTKFFFAFSFLGEIAVGSTMNSDTITWTTHISKGTYNP